VIAISFGDANALHRNFFENEMTAETVKISAERETNHQIAGNPMNEKIKSV
jgi:hypothetical protein